ncbi:alpha/beta-hydrolase [Aureobasidium pullulans]|uniref:Alpha/beta-hydrolase n=1 Tax=Aureobasidium pullulans TaxID=5580 RepID=A0A4V4KMH2_AURPU|nr:alpha/beta-hydrolase [Aureobasidium pullulans]THZ30641.1 alpha/beta-hydrolase [Aureobasidium pullulans]
MATARFTTFEGTHKTDDGVELYTKTWKVSGDAAKARMLFVHGFSDHCNNYPVFFEHLANQGIDVYAFDQRGWGRSVTKKHDRGLTGPTSRVLADITSMLHTLLPTPIPLFIMGHSMGGAEILHYASTGPSEILSQIRGFISSAPLIALHPSTRPFRATVLAGRLAGRVLPKFQLVQKLEPKWLSRDPEQNKLWEQDELCHDTGTLEGLAGMLDRGIQLESFKVMPRDSAGEGGKIRLLALHGTGDHVNDFAATKAYVEKSELSDKELRTYDGWYHNMHAEPGDDKLMFANHVSEWILSRLGPEDQKSKL